MNFLKKFLDADVIDQVSPATQTPNIAELMAKHGVQNSSENMVATPISLNTENQEKPETQQSGSEVATTNEAVSAEKVNQETPTPIVNEPTVSQKEIQQVQQDWKEVLKSQQPDTVLKELGFSENVVNFVKELKDVDPKMLAFLSTWQNNGDVTGYLKELTTDYSKMPAEEVMRHQLRQEYPKATQQQLEILFQKNIVHAFGLNSEDPDEQETSRQLLEAEADRHRDKMIANQQQYLLPTPQPKVAAPVDNSAEIEAQQQKQRYDNYKNQINNSSLTVDLFKNKALQIGEGEEKYSYKVDKPEALTNILFDSEAWANSFFDIQMKPDGSKEYIPNVEKQLFVAAALADYKGLINSLGLHFKSLGGKTVTDHIDNASENTGNVTPTAAAPAYKSIAELMAKQGRIG